VRAEAPREYVSRIFLKAAHQAVPLDEGLVVEVGHHHVLREGWSCVFENKILQNYSVAL